MKKISVQTAPRCGEPIWTKSNYACWTKSGQKVHWIRRNGWTCLGNINVKIFGHLPRVRRIYFQPPPRGAPYQRFLNLQNPQTNHQLLLNCQRNSRRTVGVPCWTTGNSRLNVDTHKFRPYAWYGNMGITRFGGLPELSFGNHNCRQPPADRQHFFSSETVGIPPNPTATGGFYPEPLANRRRILYSATSGNPRRRRPNQSPTLVVLKMNLTFFTRS